MPRMIEKIISGGQTGADQAALNVAAELGIPAGGWCPRGRWSEAGPIDERYPLTETASADPLDRTERNVRDADATLIITTEDQLTGGTALTERIAGELVKPCLVVDPTDPAAPETIRQWIEANPIRTLNIAGPRESRVPGIHDRAAALLRVVLA